MSSWIWLAKGQNRTFVLVQYSNTNSFLKVALNLEVSALVVLNSTICVSFVPTVAIVSIQRRRLCVPIQRRLLCVPIQRRHCNDIKCYWSGQEGGKPSGDVLLLILDNRGRACKRGVQTYDWTDKDSDICNDWANLWIEGLRDNSLELWNLSLLLLQALTKHKPLTILIPQCISITCFGLRPDHMVFYRQLNEKSHIKEQ